MKLQTDARSMPLLDTVHAEFARGCVYYNGAGEQLTTAFEVLDCLHREGRVTMQEKSEDANA